jgi:glycosyltransferase involved in cell wall biosynthesis
MDTEVQTPRGGTLHVADGLSEPVSGVLVPATALLREMGHAQTVVLIDRPEHAHRMLGFDDGVRLVPVAETRPRWRHWVALRNAVREQLRVQQPETVHFHGTLAWLCSLGLVREARVLVSPQDGWAPRLLEAAMDDEFLRVQHGEARRPLVVSGCHHDNRKAVELFCRAAVIFGAAELDLGFNWCGPVSQTSMARLHAAGIGTVAAGHHEALLPHLQSAWVYFAGGGETQLPVRLAQAMACGLPCLAADTPAYRDLIDDGETGLLFRSDEEARQLLTALIDDAALRRRLGRAARGVVAKRFSRERLRMNVMTLYAEAAATR